MSRIYISLFIFCLTICTVIASLDDGLEREERGEMRRLQRMATPVRLLREVRRWMRSPSRTISNMPKTLRKVTTKLGIARVFSKSEKPKIGARESLNLCIPCEIAVHFVIWYMRVGLPLVFMESFLVANCVIFLYPSIDVCRGIISEELIRIDFIVRNSDVNAKEFCSLALSFQGCGPYQGPEWSISLPSRSREQTANGTSFVSLLKSIRGEMNEFPVNHVPVSRTLSPLKVLHLPDPHFDPHYKEGSNAVCNAPLCCHEESGLVVKESNRAGRWGDYRDCDSPKSLLESMLQHIVAEHPDIDYIICTGDIIPHDLWQVKVQSNIEIIQEYTALIKQYFPNTPLYGAVGNHESVPTNSFAPPEDRFVFEKFGNQWLYDAMTDYWETFLLTSLPSTARTVGSYSVLVRPGFRLISLNSNFCYTLNWWVLYNSVDPGLVLNWLISELEYAEEKSELVHIIAHIPPLYLDCYDQWAHQFNKIVSRYSHIIKGQFYGHSHLDEFRIHYDVNSPNTPVGVQYISPNNGPFVNLNPSYRIYYIDGDQIGTTREVLDHETYIMNLTQSNELNEAIWYKLYSAKADLNLPDLSPESWAGLVDNLRTDEELFKNFFRFLNQDSDPANAEGCNSKCRSEIICSLVDGDIYLPSKCN